MYKKYKISCNFDFLSYNGDTHLFSYYPNMQRLRKVLGGQEFEWSPIMTMNTFIEANWPYYEEKLLEDGKMDEVTPEDVIQRYASNVSDTMTEIYIDYINE